MFLKIEKRPKFSRTYTWVNDWIYEIYELSFLKGISLIIVILLLYIVEETFEFQRALNQSSRLRSRNEKSDQIYIFEG